MISVKLDRLDVELLILVRNLLEEYKPRPTRADWWMLIYYILTEFYERKRSFFLTKESGTIRLRKSEAKGIHDLLLNMPLANDLLDVTRNNLLEKLNQKL